MNKIKIAIIGLGNCASSLIQGIYYYEGTDKDTANGLIHWDIGGYLASDIEVVAAFDIDQRKVGKDVRFLDAGCGGGGANLLASNLVQKSQVWMSLKTSSTLHRSRFPKGSLIEIGKPKGKIVISVY